MLYDSEPDTRTVTLKNPTGWVAGDFGMYPGKEHLPGSVEITYERSRDGSWRSVHAASLSLLDHAGESSMTQTWSLDGIHDVPEWLETLIKQYAPKD